MTFIRRIPRPCSQSVTTTLIFGSGARITIEPGYIPPWTLGRDNRHPCAVVGYIIKTGGK